MVVVEVGGGAWGPKYMFLWNMNRNYFIIIPQNPIFYGMLNSYKIYPLHTLHEAMVLFPVLQVTLVTLQPQHMVPHLPLRTPMAARLKPHSLLHMVGHQDPHQHSRDKDQGNRPIILTEDSHF